MKHTHLIAAALLAALPALPAAAQVGAASAASPGDPAARPFIEKLVGDGFAVLRDKSLSKAASRARFRTMLTQNVALDDIGMRLIRRQKATLTPAQLAAYRAAFPEFVLNAYADRLYDYADAKVQVQRTLGRGAFTEVYTRVTRPGAQPIDTIWQVKSDGGKLLVNNLVVAGVNLSLTQEADFTSYIAKNGFDALVTFMKSANAKSLAVNTK
ncbi:MlaC/ttg2D family ABC transporter substrate-binding protein [Sandarakinorhabdus oryzae]|uniref:MlaC/ttg2D family ABC transporter substrate-binding protein n=1 Tax=Sandarakinorhabdus oryzae TaxID=2675220 RepID=UPI0018CC040B|nr:ABC transporter substrate-binding protein [Sandarakinorhabdus oryzae]